MRILKLNDNTVRIFVSFTELADHNISLADFFQRSARTEQFFWELLAKAREEVDFNLDQPFWIHATVISEEEFALTVIRQEEHGDSDFSQFMSLTSVEEKKTRSSQGQSKFGPAQDWVYAFADLEDIISALRVLPTVQARTVLYEFEAEYYLVLSGLKAPRKKKIAESVLDEFGEAVMTTEAFLLEHGKCIIAENALEMIAKIGGISKA